MTNIEIPELCVVALVGASGSGKSTFAADHFLPTEVLSSDFFRGLIADDENDLAATGDAFDALYYVAAKRLRGGRLTVVDATNVQKPDRKQIVELPETTTASPLPSCSTFLSRSASSATSPAPIGRSRDGPSPGKSRIFNDHCDTSGERASDTSTSSTTPKTSPRRRSPGRSCGSTNETIQGRSTSSVTSMDASTNWSNSWSDSTTPWIGQPSR